MNPRVVPDVSGLQAALARWMTDDARYGVVATDRGFRILVWNRWMELHTGRPTAEAVGRVLFDLYPEAAGRGVKEYFDGALEGHVTIVSHGLHRYVLEMPATMPDGPSDEMPQSGQIGPLVHGDAIVGVVVTLEDVSERIASENELRRQIEAQKEARATAERALRAKDDFLSTLSHEIRTPLNAVLGWARILLGREEIEPELMTRAMQVIERNAAAQARMIDDMLDMARIVAGKLRLEMQPVDLVSVVLAAIDVVMPSVNAKGIAIHTNLDPGTPRIFGDPDRLQQVVWNLLSNAARFTPSGGTIDVRLETEGRKVRIVIADSGQGITPDFLPYVFERFRQSDASSARRHGGLGLGLALVRELVELHGGTVSADSPGENRGATFTIELQVHQAANAVLPPAPSASKQAAEPLRGVRVLVVEDEPDSRELPVTTLQFSGATVTAVASSADALAALVDAAPDNLPHVIVSDIGLPGEDGYTLIRRIRALAAELGGGIPAVAVTGYASPDHVQKALAAGYQAHISKPIDPQQLVAAVTRLCKNSAPDASG